MLRDINIKIHKEVKRSSQITMRTGAKNGEKTIGSCQALKYVKCIIKMYYKTVNILCK